MIIAIVVVAVVIIVVVTIAIVGEDVGANFTKINAIG